MKITAKLNYNNDFFAYVDDPNSYNIWLCREETTALFPAIRDKDSFTLTVSDKRQHKKGEKKITLLRRAKNCRVPWDHIRYRNKTIFIANTTGEFMAKTFVVPFDVDEIDLYITITV